MFTEEIFIPKVPFDGLAAVGRREGAGSGIDKRKGPTVADYRTAVAPAYTSAGVPRPTEGCSVVVGLVPFEKGCCQSGRGEQLGRLDPEPDSSGWDWPVMTAASSATPPQSDSVAAVGCSSVAAVGRCRLLPDALTVMNQSHLRSLTPPVFVHSALFSTCHLSYSRSSAGNRCLMPFASALLATSLAQTLFACRLKTFTFIYIQLQCYDTDRGTLIYIL